MHLPTLLIYVALASASPIASAAPEALLPSINSIGAASSISSVIASPSFTPYSMPTEDVVEWIALGDSYTAGTGCNGNAELFAGDAVRGQRSAPMQMNTDSENWEFINTNGGGVPLRFSFSAYTGDSTVELVANQLTAGAYTATNQNLPRHPFGAPQLAIMTIGGNDAYLSQIINNCLYRAWLPGDCDNTLNQLQSDITKGILKDKISYALYQTAFFGRSQGGANPRDSFQVYVSEYIPFFDETTTPCNDYSWGWWSSSNKLTQELRTRLNSLTTQVNSVIRDAANELERLGVIFVSGIASQYISGGHQFCASGHDTDSYMTDMDTWFWSQYLPTGSDTESGTSASNTASAFNNTLLQSVLDFAYGQGKTTVATYVNSSFYTAQASTPYQSFDNLINAMGDSPVEEYSVVSLQVKRSMHPKGTPFGIHKDAFMGAIANNRGLGAASQTSGASPSSASTTHAPSSTPSSKPSSTTPPPPADSCSDSYKFLFDSFEVSGKNFDASKMGRDGSGLKHQISGCGDLTGWSFNNLTSDPNGYQWHASGNLPIGTKACVGRAVISAGGASPDGCTGAG